MLVPLGARSYAIDVCDGDPARLTDAIARCAPSSVVLVTDSNVQRARGAAIEAALQPLALEGHARHAAPRRGAEDARERRRPSGMPPSAPASTATRVVVAVGGGVVGDLAGFAAACLLRGVRFVQVPTTLLAMVDASVGGKTGFDHPAGKNLIGAFHQPSAVVADLAHLETLPAREIAAGLAEVVKIALTSDADLLDRVEREAALLARGDRAALRPVVRAAIEAKIRIVREDERESGVRALLNLGHTVGHAVEAHGGFARWLHGEAVAIGLVAELRATGRLGWTPQPLADRVVNVLSSLGLPFHVDASVVAASWHYVAADKKRAGKLVRLPVVSAAGVARLERVRLETLREAVLGS